MYQLGIVKRNIARADRAAVDAGLRAFGVATCTRRWAASGLLKPYMRPIYPGAQVAGTAVTVLLHPGDNWMMHVAAEQIRARRHRRRRRARADCTTASSATCWRPASVRAARVGLVIEPACATSRTLTAMAFPVWSKAVSAKGR